LTSTALGKSLPIAALLLSAFALTACGESSQEKAKAEVCGARSDISKQVSTLAALTPSIASVTDVKSGVEAIANDLKKIKGAEGKLQPEREQQVRTATHAFETELTSIVTGITSNISLSNAETELKSAFAKLTTSYRQTLSPVNCS
jgi:Tfp pilus assembly protein PilP